MIKNDRQYKITRSIIKKFNLAVGELEEKIAKKPDGLLQLECDALKGQRLDLQRELEEYDDLKSGNVPILELTDMEDLPGTLIRGRIALGLSQKDLADRMGLQEQQIQRYEHTDYESASLARLQEVFDVLRLEKENVGFSIRGADLDLVLKKLSQNGVEPAFITKRLIPDLHPMHHTEEMPNTSHVQSIARLKKIFGWSSDQMMGDQPLTVSPVRAKFKMPKNANVVKAQIHSVYAHYVAMLLVQAAKNLEGRPVPDNPYRLRTELADSSEISLLGLVRYIWDLGVPILPLDPLSFHAACFLNGSRSVIVLAQNTKSEARWMFDLLHELYHVAKKNERVDFDAGIHNSDVEEESDANKFAHAVLLGRHAEDLLNACLDGCLAGQNWNFALLKRAITETAGKRGVRADVLSNYVAYRLSDEGLGNLWSVAENLQTKMPRIRATMRDEILERVDFAQLTKSDRGLLMQSLEMGEIENG